MRLSMVSLSLPHTLPREAASFTTNKGAIEEFNLKTTLFWRGSTTSLPRLALAQWIYLISEILKRLKLGVESHKNRILL
jgi:hypothetical protein